MFDYFASVRTETVRFWSTCTADGRVAADGSGADRDDKAEEQ